MSAARGVQGKRTLRRNRLARTGIGLQMTAENIDRFLSVWGTKDCLSYIPDHYRSILERFYQAQIQEGKTNAWALRRLWISTNACIESNMELLVNLAMERQQEQEQLTVGWEE